MRTPKERARGLQGHAALGDDEGMLFIFPGEGKLTFWNKGVTFPIDIIFADQLGEIVSVSRNVPPCPATQTDCTLYSSEGEAAYVLEVAGGLSERLGTDIGYHLKLPAGTESSTWSGSGSAAT
jgi:hypothetical protein